jgi:hypothetical protein
MEVKSKLRSDLPPLPERLKYLRVNSRGYPVPFFVQWMKDEKPCRPGEGEPDFQITSEDALVSCIRDSACWVCGQRLGVFRAYVLGPIAAINRISREPPSHLECAEFAAKACPFMVNPQMVRPKVKATNVIVDSMMLPENPGISIVWVVRNFMRMKRDGNGGILFDIGEPIRATWWKKGRPATPGECAEALAIIVPRLLKQCRDQVEQVEVMRRVHRLLPILEKEEHEAKTRSN